MEVCINIQDRQNRNSEVMIRQNQKPIPLKIVYKAGKSICKIIRKTKEGEACGTGFFLTYSLKKKCLMTCYHVINSQFRK